MPGTSDVMTGRQTFKILFLSSKRDGSLRSLSMENLEHFRGIRRNTLLLANALAERGNSVSVSSDECQDAQGIRFLNREAISQSKFDVAISNNFAFSFADVVADVKIIWMRNPGFFWKTIRDDYFSKLKHQPYIVHLSEYTRRPSWFLPQCGNQVISHGLSENLLASRVERTIAPPPVAMFSSVPARNLSMLVEAWRDVVHPAFPAARLELTTHVERQYTCGLSVTELGELNIDVLGRLPQTDLHRRMRQNRLLIIPGHREETFANLVSEAQACGLPSVTLGIGALAERVEDGLTGIIAGSIREMGLATVQLLRDDDLWLAFHRRCLSSTSLMSWSDCAERWESLFQRLKRRDST